MRSVVSVRPFSLYLLHQLTFDFDFCVCMGHDYMSLWIESQDNAPESQDNAPPATKG